MNSWHALMNDHLVVTLTMGVVGAVTALTVFLIGRRITRSERSRPTMEGENPCDLALQHVAKPERRAFPRRGGNVVEVELLIESTNENLTGWVRDRSTGGLGIILDKPLEVKTRVQVRPSSRGQTNWIAATVRSCRHEGTEFEIGLQFHKPPDWGQMMQFG